MHPAKTCSLRGLSCLLSLLLFSSAACPGDAQSSDEQARGLELLKRVIAFRTEVGQNQVPVLAQFLAEQFRAAGFAAEDIHILPLGDTASLVVRYPGRSQALKPVLALAHMDVVAANPADWQRDPFTLVEENGFLYGRGTYDVKEGLVSITSAFLRLKREGFVPQRDLIAVFTGDEETAQQTTMDLAEHHRDLIDAEFALNSDAGGGTLDERDGHALLYRLQVAEKAYASYELMVHNPGGHSSEPRVSNAIYELADVLKKIQAYRFPVMWTPETREFFRIMGERTPGPLGAAMRAFAANPRDRKADDVLFNDFAYVGVTRTTCVPTLLRGGHADNALPQSATATINCRIFPGVDPDTVKAQLQALAGPRVDIVQPYPVISSEPSTLRPDVRELVTRTVHTLHPDIPVVPSQDSGATDGAVFRQVGIPTFGTSEMFIRNSDNFAHGLNERIPVRSFYDGLQFWYLMLTDVGTSRAGASP